MKTIADKDDFTSVLSTADGRVVAVMFTATWCNPCSIVLPKYKDLERDHPNAIFTIVDVDVAEDLAVDNEVAGLPTVQFFKDGQKIHEVIGHNVDKLVSAFRTYAP
ncbi:thioredoxin-like [Sycon ciliatum]|uniref:thioredoxin-like n=1 Tax=Sycon ciliatum TaxID=27933 RepID=UPI0031F6C183|eukprot:scpid30256/ scgid22036/ Thioredoxin